MTVTLRQPSGGLATRSTTVHTTPTAVAGSVDVQGSDAGALSVDHQVISAGLDIVGVWPAAMEEA